ncbi:MAG: RNA-binding S4 domain-containing protein [Prolixibacteraceae bacterium]|jgi:ribosome-associated protein|nr:RNA-binding S4 domain-containing protein [Prolixibacteraceae bacterium]
MENLEFKLTGEYIELIKLLKVLQISESGGQAKLMVNNGEVVLNGQQELRKRAKLKPGDRIEIFDTQIIIT